MLNQHEYITECQQNLQFSRPTLSFADVVYGWSLWDRSAFDKVFTGSTESDLSIICFTERYKAGNHNSISLFLLNFIVFSTNQNNFVSNCFKKAFAILLVLIFHYSAQSVLGSVSTSLRVSKAEKV